MWLLFLANVRTSLHSTDTRIGITLAKHIDLKYAQKREAKRKKKKNHTKLNRQKNQRINETEKFHIETKSTTALDMVKSNY